MPIGESLLVAACFAALLVCLISSAVPAAETPAVLSRPVKSAEVQTHTLDNGLQVLVLEDHSAPLVCSFIWYRVGLRNEGSREAGLSHFLEHMLFKGTEKYSGREVDRLITQRGGYYNGFTSMDYTAFVETLSPSALDLAFDIESQRMAHALITAEDVDAEKGVVISEFEGAENSPSFLLRKKVMETQFPGAPYGRQVIGLKDDLRALTREQVLSYYRRYYVPNNASLVVIGDVSAQQVFAKAEQYFGGIPRGNTPEPQPNPGRGATGEQRVTLELPGRTSYVQAVYEVPPVQAPDHVALEVFQNIISGGRTGRLYQALVDTGIAAEAYGADYENPVPTVFAFEIALRPGVPHQRAEEALGKVLRELQTTPVGEQELQKAKNQTKANFVYSADGVTKLAQQIGYYHTIHTYQYLQQFPAKVDAITAADIQRVARKYFVPENRTVGWLVATGENGGSGGPPAPPAEGIRWGRQPETSGGGGAVLEREAPPVREVHLPNGMEVILRQNHSAPFVVIYGNIMAGPAFDPAEKSGLAAFTAEMVSRGTQRRSWQQIQEELEFVAAQLGFGTGQQVMTVGGQCLKGDLPLLLGAAAEQLREPSFPEEEMAKVRSEILTAQERRDEDTSEVARKELFARLYPVGHALHSPLLGDAVSVNSITRDDLIAFHQQWYRPENTILAIVGDIDPEEAEALVKQTFGDWPRRGEPARPNLPQVPVPAEPATVTVPIPNKTQSDIAIGFPGISRRDPNYYPADLMNYVLGRGFVSRLNLRIREELGAAYYVASNYFAYWGPGPWTLQMGVNPARAEVAIAAAMEEIRKMQQAPPSEDELKLWKGYVEGTVARQMETFAGIAQNLVLASFYDLGLDFPYRYPKILKAITADQVWEAAKKDLHPEGAITVIAGPVQNNGAAPPAAAK